MIFKITVRHFDGAGGNLLFDDKLAAQETYSKLETKFSGTTTLLTKAIVKE